MNINYIIGNFWYSFTQVTNIAPANCQCVHLAAVNLLAVQYCLEEGNRVCSAVPLASNVRQTDKLLKAML